MPNKIIKTIRNGGIFAFIGFIIVLIYVNILVPYSVTSQTFVTPTGNITNIVSQCTSIPNLPFNTACTLSNNLQTTPPPPNQYCSNGGVPINNICPATVVPLNKNQTTVVVSTTPADIIKINPIVNVVDDSGNINPMPTDSYSLFLNSFTGNTKLDFIATSNNILIDKGKIQLQLQFQGRVGSTLSATGILYPYINNVSLNPLGIQFGAGGMTDSSGNLIGQFTTPLGVINTYTFDIASNIGKLGNTVNILSFNMSNITVKNEKGQSYTSVTQEKLFSIEIDNIANQIINKNAQGQLIRVYPSDDIITFDSSPSGILHQGYDGAGTYTYGTDYKSVGNVVVYQQTNGKDTTQLGTLSLSATASGGQCYTSGSGIYYQYCRPLPYSGTTGTIANIPRNADIHITVTGGSYPNFDTVIHTAVTQSNIQYSCSSSTCKLSGY